MENKNRFREMLGAIRGAVTEYNYTMAVRRGEVEVRNVLDRVGMSEGELLELVRMLPEDPEKCDLLLSMLRLAYELRRE